MKDIIHVFGPGETIKGILRKYNRHKVPPKIMEQLTARFNELNKTDVVPHVGDKYTIPVYYDGTEEQVEEVLETTTPIVEPVIEPEPEPDIEPEPEIDTKTDAIVELTQEVLASIIVEEEEPEMPKPKNSSTAMLDRQRRREIARGEEPKEHVLVKEENMEENPADKKSSKFKADPVGRKKRKPVNPKKKKNPQVEEKEVDLEKEKEKEEIAKLVTGRSTPSNPRLRRDLRKRRRG